MVSKSLAQFYNLESKISDLYEDTINGLRSSPRFEQLANRADWSVKQVWTDEKKWF